MHRYTCIVMYTERPMYVRIRLLPMYVRIRLLPMYVRIRLLPMYVRIRLLPMFTRLIRTFTHAHTYASTFSPVQVLGRSLPRFTHTHTHIHSLMFIHTQALSHLYKYSVEAFLAP
jgi:hypothetical protein